MSNFHDNRHQQQIDWQRIQEMERQRLLFESVYLPGTRPNAAGAAAASGGNPYPAGIDGGSGTIVFNGIQNVDTGSWIKAPVETVKDWLPGTGDFTVEWFQYYQTGPSHPRVFSIGVDTGAKFGVSIESNKIYTWPSGNNWAYGITYVNTWVHVAIVRASGIASTYINGTKVGTGQADTSDVSTTNKDFYIGSDHATSGDWYKGNITNFRWTNSVVYTSDFDPITSPLTKLPDTKLLLLGGSESNPVVDATGINTLVNFNTTWSADSPFA